MRLIRGALGERSAGREHPALRTSPGTGKTEFCKVLAERLGVTLYRVGEADDDGDEPSRRERLQELRLAQRLVARNRSALLLFDEMEDLLSGSAGGGLSLFGQPLLLGLGRGGGSKVYMHRLLERAPGADAVGHERCQFGQPDPAAPDDVRTGAASANGAGEGADLGPAARPSRDQGRARRGARAGAGVCRHSRCGRGRHRGRRNRWRRHRDGAARAARSLPGALLRGPTPRGTAPLRPRADPGRYRPGRIGGQPCCRAASGASPSACKGPSGTGKSAFVRYLAERIGSGGDAEASLRLDVDAGSVEPSGTSPPPSPRRAIRARS